MYHDIFFSVHPIDIYTQLTFCERRNMDKVVPTLFETSSIQLHSPNKTRIKPGTSGFPERYLH